MNVERVIPFTGLLDQPAPTDTALQLNQAAACRQTFQNP
jgi:hypothetical protein